MTKNVVVIIIFIFLTILEVNIMKQLIISLAVIFLLQSCSSTKSFYQHFETKSENMSIENEHYVFENDDLKITYNLWAEYGQLYFTVMNKTNEILSIDLTQSFFVVNDFAYDYYKDVQVGESSSYATNYTYASQYTDYNHSGEIYNTEKSASVYSYVSNSQKTLRIPSGYYKQINKYNLINDYFRVCGIKSYPGRREHPAKSFSKEDTPLRFSNIITYKIGEKENQIENTFYVSQISIFRYSEYIETQDFYECEKKVGTGLAFKYQNSRNYFYKYFYYR